MTKKMKHLIKQLMRNPYLIFVYLSKVHLLNWMSDQSYLRLIFRARIGSTLNLVNPQTFNEKLQWLKLHDRKPEYSFMVDKYKAKKYVAKRIGEQYIIPTLGVWEQFDDIDFNSLPNQFVLKCTHDSGGLVICKDKSKLDLKTARKKINKSLKKNYYWVGREWPYKFVKPRIIAEKYMIDKNESLSDYKIHSFNGIPKVILVCRNRFMEAGMTEDFFTAEWKHIDVRRPRHETNESQIEKPEELQEILNLAKLLSEDMIFLRSDFYIIDGKVYFGELTFYPASGFEPFDPISFDKEMGDWLKISRNKQ